MQKMDVGCEPYKRLLVNFHQSESPYTFNVKFSKTAQNSAMNNGNSMKMLYIIQGIIVNNLPEESGQAARHQNKAFSIITRWSVKTTLKVTRHLCFKNGKNLQLLDVQACNSSNRAAFQNPTKSLSAQWSTALFTPVDNQLN